MNTGVLVLSWFLSVGSLSLQQAVQQGDTLAGYQAPSGTVETTLGVEAVLFSHFFVSGSVTTYARMRNLFSFNPSESLYVIAAGARTHGIEIGIRHECDHITLSSFEGTPNGFMANKTEVYVSVSGSFSLF